MPENRCVGLTCLYPAAESGRAAAALRRMANLGIACRGYCRPDSGLHAGSDTYRCPRRGLQHKSTTARATRIVAGDRRASSASAVVLAPAGHLHRPSRDRNGLAGDPAGRSPHRLPVKPRSAST